MTYSKEAFSFQKKMDIEPQSPSWTFCFDRKMEEIGKIKKLCNWFLNGKFPVRSANWFVSKIIIFNNFCR